MLKRNLAIAGVAAGATGVTSLITSVLIYRNNKNKVKDGELTIDDKKYKMSRIAGVTLGVTAGVAGVAALAAGALYSNSEDVNEEISEITKNDDVLYLVSEQETTNSNIEDISTEELIDIITVE